ncbi:MAG: AmmeMemoRadiSam system protein B [Candidatus Eisenbacteria bacterium]
MAVSGGPVREAAWAGQFYPSDPQRLRSDVIEYLGEAGDGPPRGTVIGLLAPHAGYIYSGAVAGNAYAAVRGREYDRVVLLAPSHRAYFRGASVWPRGAYRTPLGEVPIDEEGAARLLEKGGGLVSDLPEAHTEEHALEVQIPFLQVALPSFRLVPLVLGSHDFDFAASLARLLAETFGSEGTLYVASSDLSHFHSYDEAVRIDGLLLDLLGRMETKRLAAALERGETEACGAGPILTIATASKEHFGASARLLDYANSGDTAGGKEEVVGYAAFLFAREGAA